MTEPPRELQELVRTLNRAEERMDIIMQLSDNVEAANAAWLEILQAEQPKWVLIRQSAIGVKLHQFDLHRFSELNRSDWELVETFASRTVGTGVFRYSLYHPTHGRWP